LSGLCYNYFNRSKFSTKSFSSKADKYIDPDWLTWFIGFTEGDGGLHTNKKSCIFGLTQKEEYILQEIKSVLGFGRVYYDSTVNAYRYRVTSNSDILKLAILFNGRLATKNKINQLEIWINNLNESTLDLQEKLIFNPIPFLPTLKDSWLSGFATAEGSFFVSIVNKITQKEVVDSEGNVGVKEIISKLIRIRFVLDQKEESILLHIKYILGVGNVQKAGDTGVFRYNVGSFKSNSVVIDYFKAYPPKGKKQSAFNKWNTIHTMLLNKKHLEAGGTELIGEMTKLINI